MDRVHQVPGAILAFAHRGGAGHREIAGLENTVTAFRHAAGLGYGYLETDVHLTRDGVLVAFHDEILDRVTDRTGAIAELTYAEVRRAPVGGRERVPSLAELFDTFGDARFNIDIKADAAVAPLAALIDAHDAWDRVLIGSFSARRTAHFRRLARGRAPTAATPVEVAALRLLPATLLAAPLVRRAAAVQIPHRRGRLTVATPGLIRRAHAAGLPVHVWTIDDPDEMTALLDRGVDGLFTDRTDTLKTVLTDRGRWWDPHLGKS